MGACNALTTHTRPAGADRPRRHRTGRPHRASAELAAHLPDVMLPLVEAADRGRALPVAGTCELPVPVT
jgi:hypothetical protein